MKKINLNKGFTHQNFQKKISGGFTLLELLVVVAIVGILTTVVLVSLNSARSKGQDSSIKTQMTSLRTQADLYASGNGNSYTSLFTGDNTWASTNVPVQAILTGIDKQSTTHTAGSSANQWAAQARLKEDTTKYICIDYTAIFRIGTNVLTAGNTVCP